MARGDCRGQCSGTTEEHHAQNFSCAWPSPLFNHESSQSYMGGSDAITFSLSKLCYSAISILILALGKKHVSLMKYMLWKHLNLPITSFRDSLLSQAVNWSR